MKDKREQHFEGFYCIIPAALVTNGQSTKALLYGVISSLTSKAGFCFASNAYLARKLGKKDPSIISRYVSELEAEGWLITSHEKGGNDRKIYLNVGSPTLRKKPKGGTEKTEGYPSEKTEHSNTSISNKDSNPPNPQGGEDEKALALATEEEKNIGEVIDFFKHVNPTYKQLFPRRAQREAARRLLHTFGIQKIESAVMFLTSCVSTGDRYCPRITTPIRLEEKWGELQMHYITRQKTMQEEEQKGGVYAI